jgi:hypothetical protein
MPIARAITCLESGHSTVADVFMFWLAVMASYKSLLETDPVIKRDLSNGDKESIRCILNRRWNEIIEPFSSKRSAGAGNGRSTSGNKQIASIYTVGFVLHPGIILLYRQ